MQAVILAAGRSTRTHPVTATRPKPLVPVWGRPFLEHQLRQLPDSVSEVLLVVGYRREQIEDHFGASFDGRSITYVTQARQRGTADALIAARELIRERCLVLNGDDFYAGEDLVALAESGRGLLVSRASDPQNRAVVTLTREGDKIVDIVEKPKAPPADAWCSLGGYCVEPDDLHHLDAIEPSVRGELELPDFVLRIVREGVVRPVFLRGLWIPLTYAWDVLVAMNRFWETGTSEGPQWIGESVSLGRDVQLKGPLALGDGTVVGDGAYLDNVVTFEGARIDARARVECSVVGAKAHVGSGATLLAAEGRTLTIDVKGKRVTPDIARLGAIIADGAEVGAGETVPAGSIIERERDA